MREKWVKYIKLFDVAAAMAMTVVFAFIIVGQFILPSDIIMVERSNTVFENIYTMNLEDDQGQDVDVALNRATNVSTTSIKLFGVIPVKNANVSEAERQYVVPGGQSFGIKLYTDGVIVIGTTTVDTAGGSVNPSKIAGIEVGDVIVQINGQDVYTSDEVEALLTASGGDPLQIRLKRDEKYLEVTLQPVKSATSGTYKAGMWVRDSTAGVGTISFYNPLNQSFAGLGHAVNDVSTNEIMPMLSGEAVKAEVSGVYKGTSGETGSLYCSFVNETIGTLEINSTNGVYGKYLPEIDTQDAVPVATRQEVQKGSAQILATVEGQEPKLYDIEIERINYSNDVDQKNMVIRVTDEELLEVTGGIVQGMSGSPILQNGILVGAVTHVFVNHPSKGYAIFAESMVETSNQIEME
ncbi:MAG: SpoIVB peptidase [Clostridiales bacterium]|nr:SpoIVB peptidase [Clostridiales bacterium]